MKISNVIPCINWIKTYRKDDLISDLSAAVIVTIMLVPQSLAYALLAGLPAQVGLYASILPLVAYSIFGTSRSLSVGPVAVTSMMTAAAIQGISSQSAVAPIEAAILLALLSGACLIVFGLFRFGFLANFLSHPVVSGFISASAIIIALSQLKHILGIHSQGDNLPELFETLLQNMSSLNTTTLMMGLISLLFLFWSRKGLKPLLMSLGIPDKVASLFARTAPVMIVIITTSVAYFFELTQSGLALIGEIPSGLPDITLPAFNNSLLQELWVPALLISVIGYVESVSIAKTLASKKRQKIDVNQEFIGLGTANLASAVSGGFPVTGGFSRSAVNFDAGAETPASSFFTALGIAVATLTLTDIIAFLPKATLAATIIIAVLGLVDFSILKRTFRYSISDFVAVSATMVTTLLAGIEIGVMCGVTASLFLHLYKTSRPHIAEIGEIKGTEHFRNVKRHQVSTNPKILSLRVDESLYFANASLLEDKIFNNLSERKELKHIILMCTAINEIDFSALEVLESINQRLNELNIGFHLSEVKGPVMDTLKKSDFLTHLNGQVFLSQHIAVESLKDLEFQTLQNNPDYRSFDI